MRVSEKIYLELEYKELVLEWFSYWLNIDA